MQGYFRLPEEQRTPVEERLDGRRYNIQGRSDVTLLAVPGSSVSAPSTSMVMTKILVILMVMSLLLLGAVHIARAGKPPAPLKEAKAGDLGTILIDPEGMTLDTFAHDTEPGKSTCNGPCVENWPPFTPMANAPAPKPPLSVITHDDGTMQYAYKGKPLYRYIKDQKPGDTMGQKFRDRWFAAQP